MKQWIKGDHAAASKLDPTIGAIVAAAVDIAVRLELHTKFGIDEATLLQVGLEVAFLAFLVRSVQTNWRRKKPTPPAVEEPSHAADAQPPAADAEP